MVLFDKADQLAIINPLSSKRFSPVMRYSTTGVAEGKEEKTQSCHFVLINSY